MTYDEFREWKIKQIGREFSKNCVCTNARRGNLDTEGYRKNVKIVMNQKAIDWQPNVAKGGDVPPKKKPGRKSKYFNWKDYKTY